MLIHVVIERCSASLVTNNHFTSISTKVKAMATAKDDKPQQQSQDELAHSLDDLFTSLSAMVKLELQGTNNRLELLEKMNLRVEEDYKRFGDFASGLRVSVEQSKSKSDNFDKYVEQIDAIEQQVTEFEDVVSMLDKYVSLLESKVQSVCREPSS